MTTTYYTLAEVASMLRVSEDTIYRMARPAKRAGLITGKVGRVWRFTDKDVERMRVASSNMRAAS